MVAVSRLPFKFPAALYEATFLAEALLRRRGPRDQVTVDVYTPEPFPMPTAGSVLGDALAGMLAQRGIGFHRARSSSRSTRRPARWSWPGGSGPTTTCCSAYRPAVRGRQQPPAA